jgi:VWFA-related protein
MRTGAIILTVILAASGAAATASVHDATASPRQDQQPTFRAAVNRVAVAVTVRSRKGGKLVSSLKAEDFQLFDSGQPRPITDFRAELSPVSLGLLVDFSGSMDVASKRRAARDNAFHLLSWLRPGIDQAGLYVFDKTLREVQRLAPAPGDILAELDSINRPFGATSLFDAVAETGRVLADQGGARRAVARRRLMKTTCRSR